MNDGEGVVSPLRWRMISLAFFATVINYLDRQTLSVAAPILREQFHMSNEDYSRVVSAFLFAYTIMNGLSGPMIDRLGTRLGYGLCVAWWSIAAALHAFARGTLSLGVFRFLLGIGEAGNWPGAVKVVAEWFPEKERALAAGLFNSGSAVGAILAPPIVAYPDPAHRLASGIRVRRPGRAALAGVLVHHVSHAEGAARRARGDGGPGRGNCCARASCGRSPSRRSSWIRCGTSTFSGSRNI